MNYSPPQLFSNIESVPLYGGKSASLGKAIRAGLPTPNGYGLDHELVAGVSREDPEAIELVEPLYSKLSCALSVRSSAIGEDSAEASFAGQHLSILNITDEKSLINAVKEIHGSADSGSAHAYRERMKLSGAPKIAVAVQKLVFSETSGVLFTLHPTTHADERYIEASWGLGEAVVAGLVIPDIFRVSREGKILDRVAGDKDLEFIINPEGGVLEQGVEVDRIETLCLSDQQILQLNDLAEKCENLYGVKQDLEWAFYQNKLYLLQCRNITTF